jgi:hypothetical protein
MSSSFALTGRRPDRSLKKPKRLNLSFVDTTLYGISRRTYEVSVVLQIDRQTNAWRGGGMNSPEWVTSITDAEELKTVLKEHIDAVMGRYAKDLYAFDVINERE